VRELRNVIERAMILGSGRTLNISLGRTMIHRSRSHPIAGTLDEAESAHISQVLEQCQWRIRGDGGAARILGVKPTTLESRIKKLGLKRPN